MIRVNGQPIAAGARITMSTSDALVVEGERIKEASLGGHALTLDDGRFHPTGRLREHLRHSTGESALRVVLSSGADIEVTLTVEPVRLTADAVAEMREALGGLAASFEEPSLIAEVVVGVASEPGAVGKVAKREAIMAVGHRDDERTMRDLFNALEEHLPPLLAAPLRVQRLEPGPTALSRARLSPRSILARKMRGERGQILDMRRVEGGSPADYGWLAGLLATAQAYASRRLRSRQRIDFSGDDASSAFWRTALEQLVAWNQHPELVGRTQSGQPTWILSRSVHGAALMKQARAAHVQYRAIGRGASQGAIRRLVRMRVVDDAHLYELWVLLSVVEVLRENFGFVFIAGEPQHFGDYAHFEDGRVRFDPIQLVHRGLGLGGDPIELRAEVAFEPEYPTHSGPPKTPDVVLTIEGGEGAAQHRTVHVLDAKYSRGKVLDHVEQTARLTYLRSLRPRPTGSYVALPQEDAEFGRVLWAFQEAQRRRRRNQHKHFRYPEQGLSQESPYGLAWGAFHASPGKGQLGIRQFVTIALQYHRTELRHICGQCGHRLTLEDVRLELGQSEIERVLDAHYDRRVDNGNVARDLIEYRCPSCEYSWIRHRCFRGHVLMKHGQLTPHQQIDEDHNVECSVCGHFKAKRSGGW